jgi:cytochrome c oxidase cbb3-type subunit 4
MTHDDLVGLAKGFGLFYLIGLSVLIVAYVYWPSNKARYDRAAQSILKGEGEDRPWR